MRRRDFVVLLGGCTVLPAAGALAQAGPPARRVGLLAQAPVDGKSRFVVGLTAGLKKRGWEVGRDLALEGRTAGVNVKLLPRLAGELEASGVAVIVTTGYPAALAAKEHAKVPVVIMNSGDPVATGLVASLSRPGGHVTGVSEVAGELSAKRLEILTETAPKLRKVAMLWNADNLGMTLRYEAAKTAAEQLHIEVQSLGVREPDDFATAFTAMQREPPDAILMVTDALTVLNHRRVFDFATAHRLPAIYEFDFLVRDGGLMSYGPDQGETFDSAAGLADRILKGAAPADLPLEQPTRFRFAVNLKAAKAIGLAIPAAVLARADDIIE